MQLERLVDLTDVDSVIRNREITDALIVGPGVVTILGNVKFDRSVFEGDPAVLFIEVPQTKRQIGVVGLENVKFTRCRFRNVAIIGTSRVIAELKSELQGERSPELHLTGATGPAGPAIVGHSGFTGPTHIGPTGATGPADPRPPDSQEEEQEPPR